MNKLLILSDDAGQYSTLLNTADLRQLTFVIASDASSALELVAPCNIILGDPQLIAEVLDSAGQLVWVQSSWAGVDYLCQPGLRRDYILTGVKGIFGRQISEYVMTYLFAFERQVFHMFNNQLQKRWQPLPYRQAQNITLGIIGLGSIGRQLARTARYFGMRVTGLNRSGRPCDDVEKVYTADDLAGFFEAPDYVVLTLPDTPQTRHFINSNVLKMMKPSAVLMNVGRGNLIKEDDLVFALDNGVIAGAVLDVFNNEPLAQDSPLWQLSNVYVTPHNAATSFPEDIVAIFVENYQHFIQKEPMRHSIDFDLGY